MESETALLTLIGARITERRKSLNLTLDKVGERTGVSRAMISRIERGEVHASAIVLAKLCAGLGLTLSALFARDDAAPLLRRESQPVWQDPESGYIRREVAPSNTGLRIVEVELPAGAQVHFAPAAHRFYQHVWVMEGEIEAQVEDATHHLQTGDCLFMSVGGGNGFRNPAKRTARYAVIISTEGAR